MKTIKEVRAVFWEAHPEYKPVFRKDWRQNQYPCNVRLAFIDFVEMLRRDKVISEKLAYRVTL